MHAVHAQAILVGHWQMTCSPQDLDPLGIRTWVTGARTPEEQEQGTQRVSVGAWKGPPARMCGWQWQIDDTM